MTPLDLTHQHPRPGRAELAGIVFLARSIDKARAALPGGELNGYVVDEGFTKRMLGQLEISVDDFVAAVAAAATEDDVITFVRSHAKPGGAEAWNAWVLNREVYGGDRADAIAENPWLADHPEITLSIDFLQYQEDHGLDG